MFRILITYSCISVIDLDNVEGIMSRGSGRERLNLFVHRFAGRVAYTSRREFIQRDLFAIVVAKRVGHRFSHVYPLQWSSPYKFSTIVDFTVVFVISVDVWGMRG